MGVPIEITVFRFDPEVDQAPTYQSYPVEHFEGMRVWQALDQINEKQRANIAWRLSCREYLCGSCTIMVNGKPAPACKTAVEDAVVLEPLPYFPIVKDLVIDRSKAESKYAKLRPWLEREDDISAKVMKVSQAEVLKVRAMSSCHSCLACVVACPVVKGAWHDFVGPMYQVHLARAAFNPLDRASRIAEAIYDGLYNCAACGACTQVCPKEIDVQGKAIEQMRSIALDRIEGLASVEAVTRSVGEYGNPWRRSPADRPQWAREFQLPAKGKVVFFAGCLGSYRLPQPLRSSLSLLQRLGLEVAYLGAEEECCGYPLASLGDAQGFERAALKNLQAWEKAGTAQVVTLCAECYKTLARNYPARFGDRVPEVKHITQVLGEAIKSGALTGLTHSPMKVTYHDPCHLSRHGGVVAAPRDVLRAIKGLELVEMERAGEGTFCCGGGGALKLTNPNLAMVVGRERVNMAEKTQASALVSCCPWCEQNLRDSLPSSNRMQIVNIVDLVAESIA